MYPTDMMICKKCFMHYYTEDHPHDAHEKELFTYCPDHKEHEFIEVNSELFPIIIELEKKGYSVGKVTYPKYVSSIEYFRRYGYGLKCTHNENNREIYFTENSQIMAIEITKINGSPATDVITIDAIRKTLPFAFACDELGTSIVIRSEYINYDADSDIFVGIHHQLIKLMRWIITLKDYNCTEDEEE